MASPALIEPSDLVGDWRLTGPSASCPIRFGASPLGNGYAFEEIDSACLVALGLPRVHFWRAASDGIGLASAAGRTLAFLSREAPHRFRSKPNADGSVLLLIRSKAEGK